MNRFFLCLLLASMALEAGAEPSLLWQHVIASSNGETSKDGAYFEGLAVDQKGNTYIAGLIFSEHDTVFGKGAVVKGAPRTLSPTEGSSVLAKYSPAGDLLWLTQVPGVWFHALALTPAGEPAVVGESRNLGDVELGNKVVLVRPENASKNPVPFILFFDAAGKARSVRTLQTDLPTELLKKRPVLFGRAQVMEGLDLYAIAFDKKGDFYVGGRQSLYSYFGNGVEAVSGKDSGWFNAVVAKYAKDGTALWARTLSNKNPLNPSWGYSLGQNGEYAVPADQRGRGITFNSQIDQILIDKNDNPVVVGWMNGNATMGFEGQKSITGVTDVPVTAGGYGTFDLESYTPVIGKFSSQGETLWVWQPVNGPGRYTAYLSPEGTLLRRDGGDQVRLSDQGDLQDSSDRWTWEPPLAPLGSGKVEDGYYVLHIDDWTVAPDGSVVAGGRVMKKDDFPLGGKMVLKGQGPGQHLFVFRYKP